MTIVPHGTPSQLEGDIPAMPHDLGPTVGTGWDASRHRGDIADQTSAGDPESLPAKGTQSDGRRAHRNGFMHVVHEP